MLDIAFKNQLAPKKGRVLISDPFAGDAYFERSVVYLCEHSKEGSFGFVLNNLVEINLHELNERFPSILTQISTGGPVEIESMFFIHTLGETLNASIEIGNNLWIGGDFEQLYTFISEEHLQKSQIRFFLGYSGWSAGQLAREIDENAWVVAEIDSATEIMQFEQEDPWRYFMRKMGRKYEMMTEFPKNPMEN